MRVSLLWRAGIILLLFVLALAPAVQAAGKPSKPSGTTLSCTVDLISTVVDEQDTTHYYNDGEYCDYGNSGSPYYTLFGPASFGGDLSPYNYQTTLYQDFAVAWTPVPVGTATSLFGSSVVITGSHYVNGQDSVQNPLRGTIASNYSTLNLDLNGTSRTISLNFTNLCKTLDDCPTPWGLGNGTVNAPGLLNVFLNSSESGATFWTMGVCSSRICPEAKIAYAKFWYTDATGNWRVDWDSLRVLRMAEKTWYLIANECDGTEVAGLVKMNGKNTKGVLTGYYKIPLFITVVAQ